MAKDKEKGKFVWIKFCYFPKLTPVGHGEIRHSHRLVSKEPKKNTCSSSQI